jgi:protocatechuate 3,4-dioxygenase beta subunit
MSNSGAEPRPLVGSSQGNVATSHQVIPATIDHLERLLNMLVHPHPHVPALLLCRRRFLRQVGTGAAALIAASWWAPGAFAEELVRTPRQTEGPFFPDKLPLDTDNDLLIINDSITPAVGDVTHLGGRILDSRGDPIRNALVEIWQVDNGGAYIHSGSANRENRDANFQGYGRFLTGSGGEYYFRTIRPVAYPGRTPHIHFAVNVKGSAKFTTQCYIKGHPQNARDGILRSIRDARQRESVIVDFAPMKDSRINELAAKFDIVLGYTPAA